MISTPIARVRQVHRVTPYGSAIDVVDGREPATPIYTIAQPSERFLDRPHSPRLLRYAVVVDLGLLVFLALTYLT